MVAQAFIPAAREAKISQDNLVRPLSQESKWKYSSCKCGCLDPTVERSFMVQTAEPKDDASFGQNCKS